MTTDQALIVALLAATVGMFVWGRWRHDMVAVGALLACVLVGLVPTGEAFAGLGHPAVVTVACVLVLSRGLQNSGAVDLLTRNLVPQSAGPSLTIAALAAVAATLSGFMNNVGALALLMPIAIQAAQRQDLPPGRVLMPVSFASILGGMTTLIGTPPNLIVSGFRAGTGKGGFAMFDYAPVGVPVALAGLAFVLLGNRWLVPSRKRAVGEGFDTAAYMTEARVGEKSKAAGKSLREIEDGLDEADAQIVGLVRNEVRISAPNPLRKLLPGDVLVIEAEPEALAAVLSKLDVRLEEDVPAKDEKARDDDAKDADEAAATRSAAGEDADEVEDGGADDGETPSSDDIVLMELTVLPGSALAGRSSSDVRLRARYGVNLLAISRQGKHSRARLRTIPIREGDVLLMQGPPERLIEFAGQFGCVPLAERQLRLPDRRRALIAGLIMAVAVGGAAFGLLPAAISFAGGVLAAMAFRVVPPRGVYQAVDWPVIVLLAALIPVAGAMASTGAADLLARWLIEGVARGHAVIGLTLILIVTMFLSDFMNNAATAAVMCPIAIGIANQLGVNVDPFLMAVAVGASCAFLTPIGHQNNTLILGPGGFRFGDYWPLGLPLEVVVVVVGVPMILLVWPL